MNIISPTLFLLSIIVFCVARYAHSQYVSYAQLQASRKAEIARLDAEIADKHAQIAAFVLLFNETEQLRNDKKLLEGTIVRLDAEFVAAIHRNSAMDDIHSVAAQAWGNEA